MRMNSNNIDKYVKNFDNILNKYPNGHYDAEYIKYFL